MKYIGRDRLDPKEADYKTILTKIKGLNPDALYYGGVKQAAVKLAPQAPGGDAPDRQAGSDGVYDLACRSSRARSRPRAGSLARLAGDA